jgi:hypothetical protein
LLVTKRPHPATQHIPQITLVDCCCVHERVRVLLQVPSHLIACFFCPHRIGAHIYKYIYIYTYPIMRLQQRSGVVVSSNTTAAATATSSSLRRSNSNSHNHTHPQNSRQPHHHHHHPASNINKPQRAPFQSSSSSYYFKWFLLCVITLGCCCVLTIFPIVVLEQHQQLQQQQQQLRPTSKNDGVLPPMKSSTQQQEPPPLSASLSSKSIVQYPQHTTKDERQIPLFTLQDLQDPSATTTQSLLLPVARGIAGRILSQTPAVMGAQRAHITCDIPVDTLAYWNDPIGTRDAFVTQQEQQVPPRVPVPNLPNPFSVYSTEETMMNHHHQKDAPPQQQQQEMYISFVPDQGGWNNVRMSMEIIFVLAAVTQRTLILPPKEPLYLLHHDTASRYRGFADFFPLDTPTFQQQVKVISFTEFLQREQHSPVLGPNDHTPSYETLLASADHCDKRKNSPTSCQPVLDYLRRVGYTPEISAANTCLILDEDMYRNQHANLTVAVQDYIRTVCGEKRQQVFFNHEQTIQHPLIHFQADQKEYRLLTHFYTMIHFTNPIYDHRYKRFVRDFLHYHDTIYCAAGKIVRALQLESALTRPADHAPDAEGAGGYSALHVRRGDLQYKKVKISAQEWYDNTKEIYKTNELLYIATDERDKSFFNDLAQHHELRFLDDYWELAGLADLDPNYMGMIDTIVASRGRVFAGTWFSTFSGYINRLRGYHGMSMEDSWYSFLPKKKAVQEWKVVDDFVYAYEYPDGWIGIDADVWPSRDKF